MLNVLLDTNIVLDFALARGEWGPSAKRIVDAATDQRLKAIIPATSLKDVYYISCKQIGKRQSEILIDYLMDVCTIGDVTAETCRQARIEEEPDFEDGIVAAVAREQMADIIISRDTSAFEHATAPRINSQVFVSFFLDAHPRELFFEMKGDSRRSLESPVRTEGD